MRLTEGIRIYVEDKRHGGINFVKGNQSLVSFCRHIGNTPLDRIRTPQVLTFLDGPRTSDITWVRKYNLLRNFFIFWTARQLMPGLPMPPSRRPATRNFAPYIYSKTEIGLLLATTRSSQNYAVSRIHARTLRTFLLFLYATGILIGEARRLLNKDVDLTRRVVTIRDSHSQPSRTIPICIDLAEALTGYYKSEQKGLLRMDDHFFVNKDGTALKESNLNKNFQNLRSLSGIRRYDGIAQPPRMHDLRYTFAVHRLTAWHKHGADLNRVIPALSVYMGYTNLGATAKFLRFTPERFRTQLNKLSPRQSKRHWRDDPALIRFLATL